MVSILGKDGIQIPQGDHGRIKIGVKNVDDGEKVIFSVMKAAGNRNVLIEKEVIVQDESVIVEFYHSDTRDLPVDRYVWDLVFPDFFAPGEPHTPIRPRVFQITGVSHRV